MLIEPIFSVLIAVGISEPTSIGTANVGSLTYTHSAFVKEYEHKRDLMFADDVKAGWCPTPMLNPEDMVYAYRRYIEKGLLTEEQLSSACGERILVKKLEQLK